MATARPDKLLQSTALDINVSIEKEIHNSGNTASTTCPICQDDFEEPKLLPCAHHLCRKCLVMWLKSSTGIPVCPLCRRKIFKKTSHRKALEALTESLPTDIILRALVKSTQVLRSAHVCGACEEAEVAVNFCLHCGDKLCATCTTYHRRMTITKFHEIKSLADLTPVQLAVTTREKCCTHSDHYLDLYCPKHSQPICLQCLSVGHKDCGTIKTIKDAAQHQREIVQSQIDKLGQANVTLNHVSDGIQRCQQELTQSEQDGCKEVSALIARLSSALFSCENRLNADLRQVLKDFNRRLQEKKKDVEENRCLVASYLQQTAHFLQHASGVNMTRFAGVHAARAARLTAELKRPLDDFPSEQLVLKISEVDVECIQELLRGLGEIEIIDIRTQSDTSTNNSAMGGAASMVESNIPREWLWTKGMFAGRLQKVPILHFDPFTAEVTETVLFSSSLHFNAICLTFDNILLLATKQTHFLYMTNTAIRPCSLTKLSTLSAEVRAMALLNDGKIAITTESTSIYIVDTCKEPVHIRKIETLIPYWGIASGIDDTLIVSNDESSPRLAPSIDVITREGCFLGTLADSNSCPDLRQPSYICRMRDHVIVYDLQSNCLIKLSLNKYADLKGILKLSLRETTNQICTDYAGNIYIRYDSCDVAVITMEGQWRTLEETCGGIHSVCAYPDGSGIMLGGYNQTDMFSKMYCE